MTKQPGETLTYHPHTSLEHIELPAEWLPPRAPAAPIEQPSVDAFDQSLPYPAQAVSAEQIRDREARGRKFKHVSLRLIETLMSVSSLAQSGYNAAQVASDMLRDPPATSAEAPAEVVTAIEQQYLDHTLAHLDALTGLVGDQQAATTRTIHRAGGGDGSSISLSHEPDKR